MRLEKAENLPLVGVYKRICNEFLESNEDCMRVVLEEGDTDLTPAMLYHTLCSAINSSKSLYGKVAARQRKKEVFLTRLESCKKHEKQFEETAFNDTSFVTVEEASMRSGLSQGFWREMLKAGRCPHIKCGSKYMIDYNRAIEVIRKNE